MTEYRIQLIAWDDSLTLDAGWIEPPTEDFATVPILTVGMVLHEQEDLVVVALSWDDQNGHLNGGAVIPKACITRRETLATARWDDDGRIEISLAS